jgi:hypothetical protein
LGDFCGGAEPIEAVPACQSGWSRICSDRSDNESDPPLRMWKVDRSPQFGPRRVHDHSFGGLFR